VFLKPPLQDWCDEPLNPPPLSLVLPFPLFFPHFIFFLFFFFVFITIAEFPPPVSSPHLFFLTFPGMEPFRKRNLTLPLSPWHRFPTQRLNRPEKVPSGSLTPSWPRFGFPPPRVNQGFSPLSCPHDFFFHGFFFLLTEILSTKFVFFSLLLHFWESSIRFLLSFNLPLTAPYARPLLHLLVPLTFSCFENFKGDGAASLVGSGFFFPLDRGVRPSEC